MVPAAATGPAAPHSEDSGLAQDNRSWAHSKPSAGRHLWAGLLPGAISVRGTAEVKMIEQLNCFELFGYSIYRSDTND